MFSCFLLSFVPIMSVLSSSRRHSLNPFTGKWMSFASMVLTFCLLFLPVSSEIDVSSRESSLAATSSSQKDTGRRNHRQPLQRLPGTTAFMGIAAAGAENVVNNGLMEVLLSGWGQVVATGGFLILYLQIQGEKAASDMKLIQVELANSLDKFDTNANARIEKLSSDIDARIEKLSSDTDARIEKLSSNTDIRIETILSEIRVISERLSGDIKGSIGKMQGSIGKMQGSIGEVKGSVQALESKIEASIGKLDMNHENHKRETTKALESLMADMELHKTNGHSATMKDKSPMPKSDSLETETGDKQDESVA